MSVYADEALEREAQYNASWHANALTAEEWRKLCACRGGITIIAARIQGMALVSSTGEMDECICLADEDRHALAALALHGRSVGFTWDDVAACFHAAALVGYPDNRELPPSLARLEQRLIDLAHRIEALLPPEAK